MTLKEWLAKSEELENARLSYEEREEKENELKELYKSVEIEVGDRGSEILWSDYNPVIVIKVLSKNRLIIQELDFDVEDYYNGEGKVKDTINPCNQNDLTIISRRKNGHWYQVGRPMARGEVVYTFKYCRAYRDPSF